MESIVMKDLQTEEEKRPYAEAVKALWIEMFEDKENYVNYYMSSTWKHNRVLLLLRGKELISMLHLNPYSCVVQGEKLALHYIVGVCTKKSEQRKGYMGKLVTEALRICREAGEVYTYLMPAAEAIYQPYDFISAGWCQKVTIDAADLSNEDNVPGSGNRDRKKALSIVPFDRWSNVQMERLTTFVAQLPIDVHVEWTADYFAETDMQMKCYGGELIAVWEQDEPVAVAAYLCEDDLSEAEITHFFVHEAESKRVRGSIAEYIRKRHADRLLRVACHVPAASFDAKNSECTTMIRPLQPEWFAKRVQVADGDCMNIQNLVKLWVQGVHIYTPELV